MNGEPAGRKAGSLLSDWRNGFEPQRKRGPLSSTPVQNKSSFLFFLFFLSFLFFLVSFPFSSFPLSFNVFFPVLVVFTFIFSFSLLFALGFFFFFFLVQPNKFNHRVVSFPSGKIGVYTKQHSSETVVELSGPRFRLPHED